MEEMRVKMAQLLRCAAFLFQCFVLIPPAISSPNLNDQKSFFPITPIVTYTPPASTLPANSPPASTLPSSSPPASIPPAPARGSGSGHATPTPSGGSGNHGVKPPTNCGTPPSGGRHHTSPSAPKRGSGGQRRSSPVSTPAPTIKNPPTTPVVSPVTPTTPVVNPVTPTTPVVTTPSAPPFSFGPVSPPFTCIYWQTHPALIWALIGWVGTVGGPVTGGTMTGTFGVPNLPGSTSNTNLLQALSNTRTDGYGDLYREGTAAFLNSLAHSKFPYSTTQVRDGFVGALSSNKAAADQARIFKQANEGKI